MAIPNGARAKGLWLAAAVLCGLGAGVASVHLFPRPESAPAGPEVEAPGWTAVSSGGAPPVAAMSGRRALLVGVTRYDNLDPTVHLRGPANDVRLLRTTLIERYGFPAASVVSLTEEEGRPELRPTRANIAREFQRLAEAARAGDQVVVLLAGHGDRQPESDPPHPTWPEPDGLDEIFLPADVGVWAGYPQRVPNAIVDDEIRDWLTAITRKKAYVWAIFDCCHAGSMTRTGEVVRQLPQGVLVPSEEFARARTRAAQRTGRFASPREASVVPSGADEYLVATFACRAHETTPESPQPAGSDSARYHGLLTYALVGALERSATSPAPSSYRELMRRVQLSYLTRPQGSPTPVTAGGGQDRIALGTEKPAHPALALAKVKGEYVVNAGDLHAVTPGSVLRVYSPPGENRAPEVVGYARVERTRPLESTVVGIEYAGKSKPAVLPVAGNCEVVAVDYSLQKMRVLIDADRPVADRVARKVTDALKTLPEQEAGLFELVSDPRAAQFVVRLTPQGTELGEVSGNRQPVPLPAPDDATFGATFTAKLKAIHRAHSLIAVAARLETERVRGGPDPDVKVEVVCRRAGTDRDEVLARADAWVFRPGDKLSFRITNTSKTKRLEVTVLIVDPDYRILVFHSTHNEGEKALEPGGPPLVAESDPITDQPPFGPEHMVVIVTAPTNPPVDFRLLAQPGLRQSDTWNTSKSPLAQLLERSLDGVGTRSQLTVPELDYQGARVLNWRTKPAQEKKP